MAIDNEVRQSFGPTISILVRAGTTVLTALRDFLNAYYLAHLAHGDQVYNNVLNGKRQHGHEFKNAEKFEEFNLIEKNARTGSFGLDKKDREFIAAECKRMNVNYCLAKRPKNFETLYDRKFNLGEDLSVKEQRMLDTFLRRSPIFDENGEPKVDQRGMPIMTYKLGKDGKPQIIEGEYILQISESDIPKWEHICRKMEARGRAKHPLKTRLQTMEVEAFKKRHKLEPDKEINRSRKRTKTREVER